MAEAKDEIDLNELDSIDALLEEAEQALEEAEPELSEKAPEAQDPQPEPTEADEPEAEEEQPPKPEKVAPEQLQPEQPEQGPAEAVAQTQTDEPVAEEDDPPVEAGPPAADPPEREAVTARGNDTQEEAPPLPETLKRPMRGNATSELTDADMDKLKKLILAFGISLIVMVLVGWGLSIWAAVAASSTHLDEQTMTLLEEIKTGVEHVAVKSEKQDKTLAAVEKKIDALSFQLEQLNADMGKLEEMLASAPRAAAHGPKPDKAHRPADKAAQHKPETAATPAPVAAVMDPDVKKTLGSINSRLIRTQKKVEQVYGRLVRLQVQYKAMLAQLKKLEKGLKKPAEKKKPQLKQPYYQYQAPGGDYPFDPAHVDSYP